MPDYAPNLEGRQAMSGRIYGVTILLDAGRLEATVAQVHRWFDHRDEVTLVDYGDVESDESLGYVILEWDGFDIDELFLTILEQDDPLDNEHFFTYLRRT